MKTLKDLKNNVELNTIYNCDCVEGIKYVKEKSIIISDPPYNQKTIERFPEIAQFAADKLVKGGSLLFYAGHLQVVEATKIFSEKLRFWWIVCCLHSGKKMLMKEYKRQK